MVKKKAVKGTQSKKVQEVKKVKLDLVIEDNEAKKLDPEPIVVADKDIEKEYKDIQSKSDNFEERMNVLEWAIFGESYKGVYKYLITDNGTLFGSDKDNVKKFLDKDIKKVYSIFIDEKSSK